MLHKRTLRKRGLQGPGKRSRSIASINLPIRNSRVKTIAGIKLNERHYPHEFAFIKPKKQQAQECHL